MSDLLNSASLVMIPSGYKEDVVYSEVPTNGNGDLSFTRASNGTRVNSAGLVEVVPWNLVQNSENFSAVWTNETSTITTNSIVAPNGTTTADSLIASNGVNGAMGVYVPETTSVVKTISCYVKKGSKRWAAFIAYNGNSNCWFDLDNGVVGTRGANYSASSITSIGNGWFRIDAVMTVAIGSDTNIGIYAADNDNSLTCTGDGTTVSSYIWGFQLNIGSTAKPYFPTTDRLNVPRLTYQNGGGGCPSLLLEKQSTNGLYPSEDFSTTWSLYNSATVTTNQATSPDGTQNADKLTTTNQATALYNVNGAGTSAQAYTASLFIKYIDNTEFAIGMTDDVTGEAFARFNFTTGTATTTLQGDWSSITYAWEQQANGWYRISVTATKGASGNARFIGKGGGAYNYYIWGAQVEASSYKTSYIPTTSSSATRVADACVKTGISSLIGQTEGVLFADFKLDAYDSLSKWIAFLGGGAYYIGLYTDGNSRFVAEVYDNATSFVSQTFTFSVGTRYKLAIAYKANDFAFYVNGTQIATDNSGTVPTTSQFSFEYNSTANNNTSRTYNQVALFPTRLTNAELASLTTI